MPSLSDRELIACLYHQGQQPLAALARQLKTKEHALRYRLRKLTEDGVLRLQPFVDVYRLGYVQYELYVSLASQKKKAITEFLGTLSAAQEVAWIGQYCGEYQYGFTVCLKHPSELSQFLEKLAARTGDTVFSKSLSVRLGYWEFPLKCLSRNSYGPRHLFFGRPGELQMDQLDGQILSALCSAGAQKADLPKLLGAPESTVRYRLKQLAANGVISGWAYIVDFSKLGLQSFLLLVQSKTISKRFKRELFNWAEKHPNVSYLTENAGSWDLKLGVLAWETKAVVEVVQELYDRFGADIATVTTLTAFDYVKVSRFPFHYA